MSYLKDREIWLSNIPTGNPPSGYFWKFIQNGKVVVRDSNGNNQIMVSTSGSQAITGSLTVTGGITGTSTTASYVEYTNVANKPAIVSGSSQISFNGITDKPTLVSSSAQISGYGIFATTGSNGFNGSQSITGSLTVTGQVVAQTLNVQQVTSSVVYSSGSNVFGNSLANTQQFTGSISVTGSLAVAGAGTFSSTITSPSFISDGTSGEGVIRIERDTVSTNTVIGALNFTNNNGSTVYGRVRGGRNSAGDGYVSLGTGVGDNLYAIEGGNVGIGTSSPVSATNYIFTTTNGASGSGYIAQVNGTTAAYFYSISTETRISEQRALPLVFETSGTERMRITSGGNVGIGTDSPSAKFQVNGNVRLYTTSGDGNELRGLFNVGGAADPLSFEMYKADAGTIGIFLTANGNSYFNNGNVGIGYTSPAYQLQVLNTIGLRANSTNFQAIKGTYWGYSTSYPVVMLGDSNAANFTTVSIGYDPSSNANGAFSGDGREVLFRRGVQFVTPNAANNAFNLANLVLLDGNVGIGVTSPSATLHTEVNSSTWTAKIINTNTSGNNAGLLIKAGVNSGNEIILAQKADGTNIFLVDASGNVGIGTTSPNTKLEVVGGNNLPPSTGTQNYTIALRDPTSMVAGVGGSILLQGFKTSTSAIGNFAYIAGKKENGTAGNEAGFLSLGTFDSSGVPSERMRITSGGYLKASNTGTYVSTTTPYHELRNNTDSRVVIVSNSSATLTDQNGIMVYFSNAAPNNSTSDFIACEDSSVLRFEVRSNGGIANYQGNDVNLSDERVKKDIEPLESYWDKFKVIEIVKFKYKDQTHDDFNIGVIAQQVEQVAPEFVDVDGWDTKPKLDEEGNEIISTEEPLKSIYTADLHHATIKVLQEAMAKIEEQQSLIESLKSRIEILEQ